jgi:hypothetical protein
MRFEPRGRALVKTSTEAWPAVIWQSGRKAKMQRPPGLDQFEIAVHRADADVDHPSAENPARALVNRSPWKIPFSSARDRHAGQKDQHGQNRPAENRHEPRQCGHRLVHAWARRSQGATARIAPGPASDQVAGAPITRCTWSISIRASSISA